MSNHPGKRSVLTYEVEEGRIEPAALAELCESINTLFHSGMPGGYITGVVISHSTIQIELTN